MATNGMPTAQLIWNIQEFSNWCLQEYKKVGAPYGKNADGVKRWAKELGYIDAYVDGLRGEPLKDA